jgi:hypothetical protein
MGLTYSLFDLGSSVRIVRSEVNSTQKLIHLWIERSPFVSRRPPGSRLLPDWNLAYLHLLLSTICIGLTQWPALLCSMGTRPQEGKTMTDE